MTTTLQSEGDCYPPLPPKTTSAPRHINMPNEPVDTATCVARRNFTMSNILHCAYRLPRHDVRAHIGLPGPRNAGRRQGNGPVRLGHIGMAKEAPIWWRVGRNDGTHGMAGEAPNFGGAWDETMERMPYRWLLVTNICAYDDTQPSVNIMIIECVTKLLTSLLQQIS